MDREDFKKWAEEKSGALTEDVVRLVRIPSISLYTGDENAPFGEECCRVIAEAKKIAAEKDFCFIEHEGYCGSLLWPGKKDSEIGIFHHLDVVEVGDGWTYPPFEGVVKDGLIFGRGTNDNKGPAMASLYALMYLRERGFEPEHSIRLYFGLNEEKGMKDLEYYISRNPMPAFSFSPDSMDWPVCYGERGIATMFASFDLEGSVLKDFNAGKALNIIPDAAQATLCIPGEETCRVVQAAGTAAALCDPDLGVNAEVVLAKKLLDLGLLDERGEKFAKAVAELFSDCHGEGIGVPISDECSGVLIHSGCTVKVENGKAIQSIGIRYPVTADPEYIKDKVSQVLTAHGFEVVSYSDNPPNYIDPERIEVQEMTRICNEWLNAEYEPYVMPGGSYARKLDNAVSFGPFSKPAANRLGAQRGRGHQADEYAAVEDLIMAMGIIAESIERLDEIIR